MNTRFSPTMIAGANPGGARPSVIQLNIKGVTALYLSYIPQFIHGGLFIPTSKSYELGESVYALVTLLDNPQRFAVTGKVAWITPARASGQRPQGIGILFPENEQCAQLRGMINNILAKFVPQGRVPHTM